MHKLVTKDVELSLLKANEHLAEHNLEHLQEHGVKAFDFMGSIGSGKTLLIENIMDRIGGSRCGCISGDVTGDDDFQRFKKHTEHVVNLNTGKECHLDAHLVEHALEHMPLADIDFLFIENVGNLVCPADFPLGTTKRVVVISTTEGDDMARKHPVIMGTADAVVINKINLAEAVGVDPERIVSDLKKIKQTLPVVLTDAKTGEGIDELLKVLELE